MLRVIRIGASGEEPTESQDAKEDGAVQVTLRGKSEPKAKRTHAFSRHWEVIQGGRRLHARRVRQPKMTLEELTRLVLDSRAASGARAGERPLAQDILAMLTEKADAPSAA